MGGEVVVRRPGRQTAAAAGSVPKEQPELLRPTRGRPRSEAADRAILSAASEVLADRGLSAMSIEEVAVRAGVGKATIYRRWSSKSALALDAFLAESQEWLTAPDTGSLRGDLQQSLQTWVRAVTRTRLGSILAGLLAETRHDPELAASWHHRVVQPTRTQYAVIIDRAVRRGEVPADTDRDVVIDLLFGWAGYRLLVGHRPLNDHLVQQAVHIVTAGLAAPFAGSIAGVAEPAAQVG
jgi:AcrR family transcriptional regulator